MLPNPENIISRKSESAISSKIVINFYIVIRFGECGYLVLTTDHSFGTRFVFNMVALSIFQSAILTLSAMDLDFIDPEVKAQMHEEQMEEEEEEITIRRARGCGRSATMSLSLKWNAFDYFNSSENVLNPYCLNSFELQKKLHFPRISLFDWFILSVLLRPQLTPL